MMKEKLIHSFYRGNGDESYKLFGVHLKNDQVSFCLYAPNVNSVQVIGTFNQWQGSDLKEISSGIYYGCIDNVRENDQYLYRIETNHHHFIDTVDPYAFYNQYNSIVYSIEGYLWQDEEWLGKRTKSGHQPINIYELHLGSWKKNNGYKQMTEVFIPYIKKMHYTHILLMPLMENSDGMGYQPTQYFSAVSQYGTPKELMHFIDCCHQANIGVLMDFVVTEFVDTPFYYRNKKYSLMGTQYFDYHQSEVQSFMLSSISFWLEYFHIDGIQYRKLNHVFYQKKNNDVHREIIQFLKKCNDTIRKKYPNCLFIGDIDKAEGDYLSLDYYWNKKWLNQVLRFMKQDINETAIITNDDDLLVVSHDEVTNCKKTMFKKFKGSKGQKFAQLKLFYLYMYACNGKKMNFMGYEFADDKEWSVTKSLSWNLLNKRENKAFFQFIKDLNDLYLFEKVFWHENTIADYHRYHKKIITITRKTENDFLLFLFNFSNVQYYGYKLSVSKNGKYVELLNSDQRDYGGGHFINKVKSAQEDHLLVNIACFGAMVFKYQE